MKNKIVMILYWIIIVLTAILGIVLLIYFSLNSDRNEYNKVLENPPTINYIEEDAEFYLMSRMLEVIDVEDEVDYIIYTIYDADTKNYYKVSYKIEKSNSTFGLIVYKWVYNSHIYIGKELAKEEE